MASTKSATLTSCINPSLEETVRDIGVDKVSRGTPD